MISESKEITIREYKREDRAPLREIACDTAFMGEPAEKFFTGREFIADFLTRYHTDYEPQSVFIAEKEGKVIGYLSGAKNEKTMDLVFIFKVLPAAVLKLIFKGYIFKKNNFLFILFNIYSFFKGEFYAPAFIRKDYPAIMHINIDKNYRRYGIGNSLIEAYLSYLIKEKIKGIHLTTQSEKSFKFFEKIGFKIIYETKRSYFKHIFKKSIRYFYYGKKLS
ncbi:MAG: GNAT family N-acetyltransferase [Candidatus Humimicrobiaceae bacterium]